MFILFMAILATIIKELSYQIKQFKNPNPLQIYFVLSQTKSNLPKFKLFIKKTVKNIFQNHN